jgi:hypothetical protein
MAANCNDIPIVPRNSDITGIGVTIAFLAQVAICACVLLAIRILRTLKPKTSEDMLRFLEPVLTSATDIMSLTCIAHITTAIYTFDQLSFDQIRHILSLHWPAATLFLVSSGILWQNTHLHLCRLLLQSCCIAMVFAISVMTAMSDRLSTQMDCFQQFLAEQGEPERNFALMFKISVLLFPLLTLIFWLWTLLACWIASRQRRPQFSPLQRYLNFYADIALLFVPIAIIMVSVNLAKTNARLAKFNGAAADNGWSFGQIFSLLMVGKILFELYMGAMQYRMWRKGHPVVGIPNYEKVETSEEPVTGKQAGGSAA